MFGSQQFLLIICALFGIIPIWKLIRTRSLDIFLSMIIYLSLPIFLLQFSGLRQSIAIGICWSSINFIEQKKFIKFALVVLLASTFHYTAIVFFIAYFVYHIKITDQFRWLTILLFPLVYIVRRPLFLLLALIIKGEVTIKQTNAVTMMLVFAMMYIFVVVFCHKHYDERTNGYTNIFLCAALCMIFSSVYSTAIRIAYYFMPPLVLILPIALKKIKDVRWIIVIRTIIALCFIWFAFDSLIGTYWAMAYPYRAFWAGSY